MKSKPARKSQRKQRPYDNSKRSENDRARGGVSPAATSPALRGFPSPRLNIPINGRILYRDFCRQLASQLNPGVEPRSDWELLKLAYERMTGDLADVYAFLDKELLEDVDLQGSVEIVQRCCAKALDNYIEPTGYKPLPGEVNPFVHIRPIPDTKYSIRLFPGSFTDAEYCLDFIDSATGEPVNSPFEFELFAGPGETNTPWLSLPIAMKLRSIENAHGIRTQDIRPGEEKFILRDGQMCVLTRPGKPKIRFTVPIRQKAKSAEEVEDAIVLDFPKILQVDP
ncbi:hypothetical protein BD414DRAFT_540382 [Trametes punicea]|nr:hypothetical protein BD414DRAFT_540382 [Trametes punicea]